MTEQDDKKSEEIAKDVHQPVEISPEKMAKLAKLAADNPGLLEYAHTSGGAPVVPTEQGVIKAKALQAMDEQTGSTMGILADFMQLAMKHAQSIHDRRVLSQEVYRAQIKFTPIIGKEYFLYRSPDGKAKLLMVSPDEWGGNIPGDMIPISKLQLLHDHTWEVKEKYAEEYEDEN